MILFGRIGDAAPTAAQSVIRAQNQREAKLVADLIHTNIVQTYQFGELNGIYYIVMEYINGKILRQLMDSGAFDPKVAVHVALGILDALDESHRAGIIHRDIKPGNVMVTQSGLVKVCDFGIAHAIEESTGDATTILGTAQYFSPEQAKGEAIDARSDLYSTAVVLFEMLTARPPFSGESSVSVAFQHVTQAPPLLSSIRPELSDELGSVISRGLSKDRAERFATARDFALALRRVRSLYRPEGEPVPTAPPAGSAASAPRAAAPEQQPWGIAAEPKQARRTIEIQMTDDMRFTPDRLTVREGEVVRLRVANAGRVMHELVIGTREELDQHAAMMQKFPNMEHDEPYMAHVAPGRRGSLVWTFNRAGDFEFACLVAGHFEAGMVGRIRVLPAELKSNRETATGAQKP